MSDAKDPPPSQQFGTTMRIDIAPELLESQSGKGKGAGIRRPEPVIRVATPRAHVSASGGADFQQLFQNIYDASFVTEESGEIVLANLRANQFFHADPGQLVGYNILSLICGADESLLPTILDTLKGNRFVLMQAYCSRLNGNFFVAEISVNKLDLGGRDRLSFFVRDVTLRKEQEDKLRTGYAALQNSSSGIAITGLEADIEYCNKAFRKLFDMEEGHTSDNLRNLVVEPGTVDSISESVQRGETWAGELEMRRRSGRTFFAQTSVSANLNADGETVGMVLSVLDVTPQKMAQQQLETYAQELREKNIQMQQDLNVASELHQAFLPENSMLFPEGGPAVAAPVRFQHLYHPSGTIGGDFFDIRKVSDHEVAIFLSDVMGHGIRSALVVATIRGLIEELRPLAQDPGALMTQLNQTYTAIFQQMGGDVTFSTAFYGVMDTRTGLLRYANASHPTPYVLRRKGAGLQRLRTLREHRSRALGLFPDAQFATFDYPFKPGNVLMLFTDGLSEVEGAEGELYDAERFEEVLREKADLPPSELLSFLLDDARAFSGRRSFEDDVCIVTMEVLDTGNGPDAPGKDAGGEPVAENK